MTNPIELTLDGSPLMLPNSLDPRHTLAIGITPSSIGPRVDVYSYGAGMPDVMDVYEWEISYDGLDTDIYAATLDTLEDLRTTMGVHLFCDWSKRRYTYTAASGQQFFYLPRQDAFSKGYAGHTLQSSWGATITRTSGGVVTTLTVLYKPTVASGDVVPTGEVWIGNTPVWHPTAGKWVAPFKVGTPILVGDVIKVKFFAVYRVGVQAVSTLPFQQGVVGLEGKSIYLPEVA